MPRRFPEASRAPMTRRTPDGDEVYVLLNVVKLESGLFGIKINVEQTLEDSLLVITNAVLVCDRHSMLSV